MKRLSFFAIYAMATLAMALAFGSCKKEKYETMSNKGNSVLSDSNSNPNRELEEPPLSDSIVYMPPTITTVLPSFPCDVLFVINKEYELAEDGLTLKTEYNGLPITAYSKGKYLELRLADLYPNLVYEGLVDDSQDFCDSVKMAYEAYLALNPQTPDTTGMKSGNAFSVMVDKDEDVTFMTEEQFFVHLKMTDEERALFNVFKGLAASESYATLEDILKASENTTGLKQTRFCWAAFSCICILAVGYVSNIYYTAITCRDRASNATSNYYSNYSNAGQKGDAFRHISVSMMLRRYLNLTKAFLIMDVIYEGITNQNEYARDTHMDLHNNWVGRETKYWTFRGSYFGDMYSWQTWLYRIKSFVDNSNNGVHKSWTTGDSFSSLLWDRLQNPCPYKYIYYAY